MKNAANPKIEAIERATKIYDLIIEASVRADKALTGESLRIYNEICEWGLQDNYPISDTQYKFLYVSFIAMTILRNDENLRKIDKTKKSKWDIIQSALTTTNKSKKKV